MKDSKFEKESGKAEAPFPGTPEQMLQLWREFVRAGTIGLPPAKRAEILWEIEYDPLKEVGSGFTMEQHAIHLRHLNWKCHAELYAAKLRKDQKKAGTPSPGSTDGSLVPAIGSDKAGSELAALGVKAEGLMLMVSYMASGLPTVQREAMDRELIFNPYQGTGHKLTPTEWIKHLEYLMWRCEVELHVLRNHKRK